MEAYARAPDPLTDTKPMNKTWNMWKQEFLIFLKAAGFADKESNTKACFLMNNIGKVGIQALQNIEFDDEQDKENFDILIEKFDEYFDPPKREIEERYKFHSRSRKANESIEDYIADLKEKAKTCNFGILTDSLIRDRVILDIKDKDLRQMMFEDKKLDLEKLIIIYKEYTRTTQKMKEVTRKLASENMDGKNNKSTVNTSTNNKTTHICWRCGTSHQPRNCPAYGTTCEKCKEKGHFTQRCNVKNLGSKPNNINLNQNANKNKNYTKNPFNQTEKNNKF